MMYEAGDFDAYQQSVRATRRVLLAGLLAPVAFATQARDFVELVSILGVACVLIGSAFGLGGAIGFLFGIPRSLQDPAFSAPPGAGAPSAASRTAAERYAGNTSLEQISDWLTKILVGVGLTQLTNVPAAMSSFAAYLAPALGGFPSSGTFGVLLAAYYTLGGLFLLYMWTRLYMALLLTESDSAANRFRSLAGLVTSNRETEQSAFRTAVGTAVSNIVSNVVGSIGKHPSEAEVEKLTSDAISTANLELERQQVLIDITGINPTATEPIRVAVADKTTVAELLNIAYFAIADVVPPFSYGLNWILEDQATGEKLDQIGTIFAETNLKKTVDERPLSEVGIKPGMQLRAVPTGK